MSIFDNAMYKNIVEMKQISEEVVLDEDDIVGANTPYISHENIDKRNDDVDHDLSESLDIENNEDLLEYIALQY